MSNARDSRELRRRLIDVAQGHQHADVIVTGGTVVNVYTAEMYEADVAIAGSRIAAVGDVAHTRGSGTKAVDASGLVLTPGFIDQHAHVHESQLNIVEFAAAVVPRGTVGIGTDFYGEVVVSGVRAAHAALGIADGLPLKVWFLAGMPAYYQNRPFGHSGTPSREELLREIAQDYCLGIDDTSSMRVVAGDESQLEVVDEVLQYGKQVSGHGAGLSIEQANAWAAYCLSVDDHECVTAEEAVAKARLGIRISVREGSGVYDLDAVIRAITEHGVDARRFCFCTDVPPAVRMTTDGHIDYVIRRAIAEGLDPITAIQMATLNAAECLRVDTDHGAIAPGKIADIVLLSSLEDVTVDAVIVDGRLAAEGGALLERSSRAAFPEWAYGTVRLREVTPDDLALRVSTQDETVRVRVIEAEGTTIITQEAIKELPVTDGCVVSDPEKDILKLAAFERVRGTGEWSVGLVCGFGLKRGALATTFNSQAENLMVVGASDQDMAAAANALREHGGGFAIAENGAVEDILPLPLFGLEAELPYEVVAETLQRLNAKAGSLGCPMPEPFATLGFIGTPVEAGHLKLAPEGLVEVGSATVVPLGVDGIP
jgi:adenine deaminase